MKDKLYIGFLAGFIAPVFIVLLLYLFRFNYLSFSDFISQSLLLGVYLKIIALGVFFADLGIFYLFLHLNKNNASKGVILAVIFYFFLMLFLSA